MASYEDTDSKKKKRNREESAAYVSDRPSGLKLVLKLGANNSSIVNSAQSTPDRSMDTSANVTETENSCDGLTPEEYLLEKKRRKRDKDRERHRRRRLLMKEKLEKRNVVEDDENSVDSVLAKPTTQEKKPQENDEPDELEQPVKPTAKVKEKTPFQKLLDHLHESIEKKDSRRFFAWPVTDIIAPGYSQVIAEPMDLYTMKHKINNNEYNHLEEFVNDFKLMCKNAMVYNHSETVYYKAAKKLLHTGLKITSVEKIQGLQQTLPFVQELLNENGTLIVSSNSDSTIRGFENTTVKVEEREEVAEVAEDVPHSSSYLPQTPFEAIPDSLTAEEIQAAAQNAAKNAAEKLNGSNNKVGFLRKKEDGSTTLAILVPSDGIDKVTHERPILLGSMIGKLTHGTGNVQTFREDKRNAIKLVKPVNYGAFGSYAPVYDSTFANTTKEETELLQRTYGDETGVQYADSVIKFAMECDYTTIMVDNLLDIMTDGDHRKVKKLFDDKKQPPPKEGGIITNINEREQQRPPKIEPTKKFDGKQHVPPLSTPVGSTVHGSAPSAMQLESKFELGHLKTLSELGIDTSFLGYFEDVWKEEQMFKDKLNQTKNLLEILHQIQNERLSAPLPAHLSNIPGPSEMENQIADRVTANLKQIIQKVPPSAVCPVTGIRKALGIASVSTSETSPPFNSSQNSNSEMATGSIASIADQTAETAVTAGIISNGSNEADTCSASISHISGLDLESELQELLDNDTAMGSFHA